MWGDRKWPKDRLESKPALLLSGSVALDADRTLVLLI